MSFYKPIRSRNLYESGKDFKLSRSKIDLYLECPYCFYLDRKCGVGRPPSFPFNLNSAVDHLLKKEFDHYREKQIPHPLMEKYGIQAVPFQHEDLEIWRENFKGLQVPHPATNFIITGAIDDLWVNLHDELIVVDYKATSKDGPVSISAPWQIAYKRQMEIYQWLLKQLGYLVSPVGYFVYCNGIKSRESFNQRLEFTVEIIPYRGNDNWIEPLLTQIYLDLQQDQPPASAETCDYCKYREAFKIVLGEPQYAGRHTDPHEP